jgi:hypothetical protein
MIKKKAVKNKETRRHCELYDAYFEPSTGEWLEKQCSDVECGFCSKRPKKHKPHKWEHISGNKFICGGA